MTAFFMAAAVLALNLRSPIPSLKEGESARRDYRARVTFRVADAEATRLSREDAEGRAPRVFRESAGHLADLHAQAERLLSDVLDARKAQDLKTKWGLSEAEFQTLKEGLDRKWVRQAADAVAEAARKAVAYGIMDSATRQAELGSSRYEFLARGEGAASEEARRSTTLTLEYPGGVREFLFEELQPLFGGKSDAFRHAVTEALLPRFSPTLKLDGPATAESMRLARSRAPERFRTVIKDTLILSAGEPATPAALRELRAESAAWGKARTGSQEAEERHAEMRRAGAAALGMTVLFVCAFVLLTLGVSRMKPEVFESNTRIAGIYLACLTALTTLRVLENLGVSPQWTPIPLAAMFVTVTAGPGMALATTAFLGALTSLMSAQGAAAALPLALSGAAAALLSGHLRRRTHAFETGIVAGVIQASAVAAVWTWQYGMGEFATARFPVEDAVGALGSGALAGALLSAGMPYVERAFDVATDMRLLEWTDQNQPLLRRLALDAPGSYHHSAVVSSLAEGAAKEIGANPLLACAGGYLHDVGKIARPDYFIENLEGRPSPHANLSPTLSALILTAHTKDGVEIAEQYGVPAPIRRIIAEHHGTYVAEFFYRKAQKEAEKTGGEVKESMFRYRGPRPRSRESAIVMLADAAESATRALSTPSPAAVERLVHELVEARLRDGQLDESRMDITDVRAVERSLARSLLAMAHSRIRYPGAPAAPSGGQP